MMKKLFTSIQKPFLYLVFGLSALYLNSCKTNEITTPAPIDYPADVPIRWAKMSLKIAEKTPGNTPTYASRGFGFLGLTMYETIVNGYLDYKSMVSVFEISDTIKASRESILALFLSEVCS